MGDCLLLTAPVRALKAEFPAFRVSVLVESRFASCFDGNPDFDEVLIADAKVSTALRLLARRFNVIFNLHGGPTSLVYSCCAWGKRLGFQQYRGAILYHGRMPAPLPEAHTVEAAMAAFRRLGLRGKEAPSLRFEPHPAEAQRIQSRLKGRPYAVIQPAAMMETKRWEPGRFAEIGRDLAARGLTVVITTGPGEEPIAIQVARDLVGTVMMLGLTIPELAELIRGARIYVGNDSGPMHIAAAVGTPIVAVWGSSDSRRWRPWGVEHRVVQNVFECNPCAGYRCRVAATPLCIESVTVQQVKCAVTELLRQHDTQPHR
jgi:ADP-heptose:LPS heptosyltransferase